MRAVAGRVALALCLAAAPAAAQGAELSVTERMAVVDRNFDRAVEAADRRVEASGWGRLDPVERQEYRILVDRIDASLGSPRSKPRLESVPVTLGGRLTTFFESIDSIYGYPDGDLPAEINVAKDSITLIFVDRVSEVNAEYYRRFFVKYGDQSERLNFLEGILLNRVFSRTSWDDPERPISAWEPIARVQVVGYEWDTGAGRVRPSPPIFQVGLTRYLFGEGRAARWVNHLGAAAAYQPDATGGTGWWGFMGHVRNLDVGVLCPSWECRAAVVVTSVNVQVVREVF